jgi:hypothetical protein
VTKKIKIRTQAGRADEKWIDALGARPTQTKNEADMPTQTDKMRTKHASVWVGRLELLLERTNGPGKAKALGRFVAPGRPRRLSSCLPPDRLALAKEPAGVIQLLVIKERPLHSHVQLEEPESTPSAVVTGALHVISCCKIRICTRNSAQATHVLISATPTIKVLSMNLRIASDGCRLPVYMLVDAPVHVSRTRDMDSR